ncbi:MAG: bifunctional oligoribonuclease/PAP phosphatase NrnA, partial [Clostridium sp.]|nr:bifunctional oligoribonuclease/PAP phosphatase NrnA [Clostridium sp.]
YAQTKLHGCALLNSERIMDDKVIYTVVTQEQMANFGCNVKATDGIVDQLRVIDGVEAVILLYETGNPSEYKVSLRTNTDLDLARIAAVFGGGGHVKAAGCTVTGTVDEILEGLKEQILIQWAEV